MEPDAFAAFTDALVARVAERDDVLGVVALGSASGTDGLAPDQWSDHDVFVVTRPGTQEVLRTDLSWLPDPTRIVLAFRETAHGVKALYDDGHLVELAVFDVAELALARVNRYRVLLDRGGVSSAMAAVRVDTEARPQPSDEWLVGMFLTNLLVGVTRAARGEVLSGQRFVHGDALGHFLSLLARHAVSVEHRARLDDLDPRRRFEQAAPELAAALGDAVRLSPTHAARVLLDIADTALASRLQGYPSAAAAAVRRVAAR